MNSLSLRRLSYTLAVFCLFFLTSVASAQDKEWRPVSPEDLSAKAAVVEPDADAEAMFWEVRIDDSSEEGFTMRHYVRVKIFTERGREKYSKFDIPFTKGLKIKELSARVIKADGTAVEIRKEDIFEREIIKAGGIKIKAKSFAVPNIEPGVIVEYRYKESIASGGAKGMRLPFQRDIPVRNLSYYYKPYNSNDPHYQSYNFTDTKFVKDQKGYWLATRKNVPAFREEPQMPPEDMVRPWMLITGVSNVTGAMGITYTIKDPSNVGVYWGGVAGEWAPVAKLILKPSGDVKKAAAQIAGAATTPDEKLRKLYEFVQKEIKNTTFDPTLTDEDREKLPRSSSTGETFKRKSGSAGEIDMLFGSMAAALGMETRLALTGDRSEMFFKPEMTNEDLVHPAAVAVKVGEEWKFFNPGMAFVPYGMLIWEEEDTWGLLVGEKIFNWQQTPFTPHEKSEQKRDGKFKLLPDGTLEGTVQMELTGQTALTYRIANWDDSPEKREENLKEDFKRRMSTAEVSEVRIENVLDASKPIIQAFKIRVPNYAQKTGKRLFFQPGFFEYGVEPLFSSAARKYDVFFRYPWSETDSVNIELPAGFDLDNADSPGDLADPQKIASLGIAIRADRVNNMIYYNRKFHFGGGGNTHFPVTSYAPVKSLFDAFHKMEAHTITLKQK